MRKLQLYVTEEQYRLLKAQARRAGSIAQVVRELIDAWAHPADPTSDPFYEHLVAPKRDRGERFSAEQDKRALHGRIA